LVTGLDWTESFLVGALLAPTDPVLSSSVVTNPRVPRVIRHSLNLESGMNDGLALPAVLALTAALDAAQGEFVWWQFVLQDISVGLVTGIVVGLLAAAVMPKKRVALFALGVASVAYGVAIVPPHGNGLIATFVAAITLAIRRPDVREAFESRADDLLVVVKLGVFLVFGALLTFDALTTPEAVAIAAVTVLLARPVAVFAALAGTRTDMAQRAFMSWFGPKGVATMTFAILVLGRDLDNGRQIFEIAAVAVFISVIVHGLTDRPGAEWMARRSTVPAGGDLGPERA
jgi:NhaP-type Na+/H+ or K+/H+ antiporter